MGWNLRSQFGECGSCESWRGVRRPGVGLRRPRRAFTCCQTAWRYLSVVVIKPRRPWRHLAEGELATVGWVEWYNTTRLHGEIGHMPPDEHESRLQRQPNRQVTATA